MLLEIKRAAGIAVALVAGMALCWQVENSKDAGRGLLPPVAAYVDQVAAVVARWRQPTNRESGALPDSSLGSASISLAL